MKKTFYNPTVVWAVYTNSNDDNEWDLHSTHWRRIQARYVRDICKERIGQLAMVKKVFIEIKHIKTTGE